MARICILGDSWACGEWQVELRSRRRRVPRLVPGTGFGDYLQQHGHRVTSVAEGGSSNLTQLARLTQYPRAQHTFDLVIMVLTDPLRDVFDQDYDDERPQDWNQYHQAYTQAEQEQYQALTELTAPVWLVGGCVRVNESLAQELGLQVAEPDWFERLCAKPRPYGLDIVCRSWPYWKCEISLLEYLEQQQEQEQAHIARSRIFWPEPTREYRYFGPDGVHPNRQAHQELALRLHEQIGKGINGPTTCEASA